MPNEAPADSQPAKGITEFTFQVCSRCGHPPSDGPCSMGNTEHAETWPKSFAGFGIVRDLTEKLGDAERECDELKDAAATLIERLADQFPEQVDPILRAAAEWTNE